MGFNNKKMTLASGVFFRELEKEVYLRNVDTRREYILNSMAGDILNALRSELTFNELVEKLSVIYEVTDSEKFKKDISVFLHNAIDEGYIVITNNELPPFSSLKVIDHVQDICIKNKQLWTVGLELTYRCNEKCIHCYIDDPSIGEARKELEFSAYKSIIDQLADMGCASILVTGGEPTLHKDFLQICRYIVQKGMLLDIFTNALYITTEVFDALREIKINSISFSLYGATPEFHDSITQVKGSFEKSFKNILMFKSAGFDVFVKTVLFKNHFDEYIALRKLTERFNLSLTQATILTPGHSGKDLRGMMLDDDDFKKYLQIEKADKLAKSAKRSIPKESLCRDMNGNVCTAGINSLSINPFGDIFPCNSLMICVGNVKEASIQDIWNNSPELERIRNFRFKDLSEECSSCKYSCVCMVCLGAAHSENNGEFRPNSYTCNRAKLTFDAMD